MRDADNPKTGHGGMELEEQPANEKELLELEAELRRPISAYTARSPSMQETDRLIALLQPEFDSLKPAGAGDALTLRGWDTPVGLAAGNGQPLTRPSILRHCFRLAATYSKGYWLVSAVVFIMLTLISETLGGIRYGMPELFPPLLPLIMLACALYSYRSWNEEMRTVESITPFPPALHLLCRLLLVLAMNIVYGLLSTIYLNAVVESFPFLPFFLRWMSELLLIVGTLSAVMFWKGTKAGYSAAVAVWVLWQTPWPRALSDSFEQTTSLYAAEAGAMGLGLLLLAVAYRECLNIRWMKG